MSKISTDILFEHTKQLRSTRIKEPQKGELPSMSERLGAQYKPAGSEAKLDANSSIRPFEPGPSITRRHVSFQAEEPEPLSSKYTTQTKATPSTKQLSVLDQLKTIDIVLQGLLFQCSALATQSPKDPETYRKEHLRLSEAMMQQVVHKIDAIKASGNGEARRMRKTMMQEAQSALDQLDT